MRIKEFKIFVIANWFLVIYCLMRPLNAFELHQCDQ